MSSKDERDETPKASRTRRQGSSQQVSNGPEPVQRSREKRGSPGQVGQSLETFLIAAYSSPNQKPRLTSKQAKALSRNLILTKGTEQQLQPLVEADQLLAVPYQLLLVARRINQPRARDAIRAFVRDRVLDIHPIFSHKEIETLVCGTSGESRTKDAFEHVRAILANSIPQAQKEALRPAHLEKLVDNAARCLVIWVVGINAFSDAGISILLYTSIWGERAGKPEDIAGALMGGPDFRAAALACGELWQGAVEARREGQRKEALFVGLKSENEVLRDEVAALKAAARTSATEHDRRVHHLEQQCRHLEIEKEHSAIHARDRYERLRTRVLRCLSANDRLLEDGLEALRRPVSKPQVTADHLERSIDSIKAEIENLRAEA